MGYLTPETIWTAKVPSGLVLEDEIEALTREVGKLKAKGINIIVAIGHSGYHMDQKVATEVPDIDIIVGAHSHTFLFTVNSSSPNPSNNKIKGRLEIFQSDRQYPPYQDPTLLLSRLRQGIMC